LVVMVIEGLRHNPTFIKHRPEFVPAAGIVVAHADGRLTRIAANDHELHAFAEVVGKCSHYPSLLFLLILLLTLKMVGALFDMGAALPCVQLCQEETAQHRTQSHSQNQFISPNKLTSKNRNLSTATTMPKGSSSTNSLSALSLR